MNNMHRNLSGFAALVILAASVAASSKDEQQIRALYAKFGHAMKTLNLRAIEAAEAPGFTETEMGKTYTAQEANSQMKQQFAMTKQVTKMNLKVTSIKVTGKTAAATTSYSFTAKVTGRDKKLHTLSVSGTTAEDLMKTSKGWMFKSERDTGSKIMMDGKPFSPGAGG